MANAIPVDENFTTTADFPNNDTDWYRVEADAGDGIRVVAELTDYPNDERPGFRVDIFDADGERISGHDTPDNMGGPHYLAGTYRDDESAGERASTADVIETNGTYYVRVTESEYDSRSENATATYDLSIHVQDRDPQDPNEGPSTATQTSEYATYDGVFSPYDPDWYAVNLTAGESINVRMKSVSVTDGSWASKLYIVNPAGERVGSTDPYRTMDEGYEYTAEQNGTYYVELNNDTKQTAELMSNTTYKGLTIITSGDRVDEQEPNDLREDAMSVEARTLVEGQVENAGDPSISSYDWYQIKASAGDAIRVDAKSFGDEGLEVLLFGPNGDYIDSTELNASNRTAYGIIANETGTYFVRVTDAEDDTDFLELYYGIEFTVNDADGERPDNWPSDSSEVDTDGDGLTDVYEADIGTNSELTDTDDDGVTDSKELTVGTHPTVADSDDDGLLDGTELALGTVPSHYDTDGDVLPDGQEKDLGTDPLNADTDGDGLTDGKEFELDTSPLNLDTDGDGISDGKEVAECGSDPLAPANP